MQDLAAVAFLVATGKTLRLFELDEETSPASIVAVAAAIWFARVPLGLWTMD